MNGDTNCNLHAFEPYCEQIKSVSGQQLVSRAYLVDSRIGDKAQEDAKGSAHLPRHSKTPSNDGRRTFGSIYRHCARIRAQSETKHEAEGQQLRPTLTQRGADGRDQTDHAADENCSSSTPDRVDGLGQPGTPQRVRSDRSNEWPHLQQADAQVGPAIDQPHYQRVTRAIRSYSECLRKSQVRPVRTRL